MGAGEEGGLANRKGKGLRRWTAAWRGGREAIDKDAAPLRSEETELREGILEEARSGTLNRRPDKISITVHRSSQEEFGCDLFRDSEGAIRVKSVGSGLLSIETSFAKAPTAVCADDILEFMDGFECRGKPLEEVTAHMTELQGKVTFAFSTIPLSSNAILCQAIAVRPRKRPNQQKTIEDVEGSKGDMDTLASFKNHGLVFGRYRQDKSYLCLRSLHLDGWFAGAKSVMLERGSLLVSIGNSICLDYVDVNDAGALLQTHVDCCETVSVITLAPTQAQRQRDTIRRTAKAVGGGTMIGVGAVMMVTPLHPIGHAMAIGGVGIVGSEFDGAKKAVSKAKNRINPGKKAKDEDKHEGGDSQGQNDVINSADSTNLNIPDD